MELGKGEGVRKGGGRGWGRARTRSKVADVVFTSYIHRTKPFTKLFTEKKKQFKRCFYSTTFSKLPIYYKSKFLITEKSPSRITR